MPAQELKEHDNPFLELNTRSNERDRDDELDDEYGDLDS